MQIIGQIIIPNVYSLYPDTMQIYYKQSSLGGLPLSPRYSAASTATRSQSTSTTSEENWTSSSELLVGISFLFQSINCCLHRGGPRGHGYPESLRWREVVRSDVSHCESLGEHEPSVQAETSSKPSVCLLTLAKLVSSTTGLWTSGMCSWTTSTGSRFREPCSALVSRSRIISSSSSGWFSLWVICWAFLKNQSFSVLKELPTLMSTLVIAAKWQ